MFLKKAKGLFKSLSSRLAFSYLVFFLVSVLLIFGVLFYSMAAYLAQKDHDIIDARFQQYQQLYESEGLAALKRTITNSRMRSQSAHFLIYLKDANGVPVFLHLPEELENFVPGDLQKQLAAHAVPTKPTWFNVPSKDGDEDALEIRGARIEGGEYLHVGARTDSRDEILERILQIFMLLLLPFLLVAIVGAFLIAKRSLRPVRHLIETVGSIKNGDLSVRVPMHETHDELHELGSLFNEMIERLQELMNAMRDTLDNVAHDLKTPITRLKAAGELALRSDDNVEIRAALSEAIENSDEIQNLIQTIMTVSEINSKMVRPQTTLFSLNEIIDEVLDIYHFVAEDKSIEMRFMNEGPLSFEGDRVLIKQAVANLLDNALKYSPAGREVRIYLVKANGLIQIRIVDQGIGISETDLPRIWERLYRGDKSRHEPGLGLGLSLVKAIVEAHGGKMKVESEMNRGSTFTIMLPVIGLP